MDDDAVLAVLDSLAAAGCRAWVAGGWGVDALIGRQTRRHRDLDLAIDARAEDAALHALAEHGYAVETDWRPVRVELAAPGDRWVDLHPVLLDDYGNGTQQDLDGGVFVYPADCFVTGTIGGRTVSCLSVEQQLIFHSGYQPRDVDLADIALLRALA
ncbi:nucleotidyltransferase domain-containing protein [Pseudactinotalea suaedae]|uniref:nucleotidyltransferase domain-containing protein n=1 Tax=Pseudactinotalea suaedae TaxID=1524924 RepID=UPI0012E13A81|nr:amino acid transporter [Pseudactinotalea suaedae]